MGMFKCLTYVVFTDLLMVSVFDSADDELRASKDGELDEDKMELLKDWHRVFPPKTKKKKKKKKKKDKKDKDGEEEDWPGQLESGKSGTEVAKGVKEENPFAEEIREAK